MEFGRQWRFKISCPCGVRVRSPPSPLLEKSFGKVVNKVYRLCVLPEGEVLRSYLDVAEEKDFSFAVEVIDLMKQQTSLKEDYVICSLYVPDEEV